MNKQLVEISKFLSFVLRHKPQAIGITLDAEGWVPVDELLAASVRHGQSRYGLLPFDRMVDESEMRRLRLKPEWFATPAIADS